MNAVCVYVCVVWVHSRSVASVGVMSHTLRVQATDEVYKTTKEKMTLVDNEVKKVR